MCTLLSALSSGATLVSGIAQARNARAQANAQADALEANARNSRVLAHDAIERGGQDELQLRRSLAQLAGNQRVQAASSGIDINSGSALDARNASIAEGEHDAEAIRFNAARQRWGYDAQANSMENQAAYSRAYGRATADNILFRNVVNFGLDLGENIYNKTRDPNASESPLTDYVPKDWAKTTYLTNKKRRQLNAHSSL